MYCPNCGNKGSEKQRFCRACGFGLEKVAQSLAEQMPGEAEKTLLARKERLERLGVVALTVFGLSIIGFISYTTFSKLMVTQGSFLAALIVLGGLLVVGCGLLSVILFARANELKEAAAKRRTELLHETSTEETTGKLLDMHHEPIFSVADRTTELLSVKKVNGEGANE